MTSYHVQFLVLSSQKPHPTPTYFSTPSTLSALRTHPPLNICGSATDCISLAIHVKPSNITDLHSLTCTISATHSPLHDITKFKIIHNVPIHPNIIEKQKYLIRTINSFGSCFGILYNFSHGHGPGSPHPICMCKLGLHNAGSLPLMGYHPTGQCSQRR
jgi:hypothetical protein